MIIVAVISTVAILVGIVGCAVIWGLDASRAKEISRRASDVPKVRPATDALPAAPSSPRT